MSGTACDPFYWNDWQGDPKLGMCSLAAQGLWMRMLCLAAEADPKGYVTINGKNPTYEQLGLLARIAPDVCAELVADLESNEVFSRTRNGIIYSRRMLRGTKRRAASAKGGKKGGRATYEKQTGIFGTQAPAQDATQDATQYPRRATNGARPFPSPSPLPEKKKERATATRWPAGQKVPSEWIDEVRALMTEQGVPLPDFALEAIKFASYWPAHEPRKDWATTWRNWCLRAEPARNKPPRPNGSGGRIPREEWDEDTWRRVVRGHCSGGDWDGPWPHTAGPKPGQMGCEAPKHILAAYGFPGLVTEGEDV